MITAAVKVITISLLRTRQKKTALTASVAVIRATSARHQESSSSNRSNSLYSVTASIVRTIAVVAGAIAAAELTSGAVAGAS